jgi:RsiW-degrading membrane proteinase PrsW (M82 family)
MLVAKEDIERGSSPRSSPRPSPVPANAVLPAWRRGGHGPAKAAGGGAAGGAALRAAAGCVLILLCLMKASVSSVSSVSFSVSSSASSSVSSSPLGPELRCALSLLAIAAHPAALYWAYARLRLSQHARAGSVRRVFAVGAVLSVFAASYEQVAQFVLARGLGYASSDAAIAAHSAPFARAAGAGTGPMSARSVVASLAFFVSLSYGTTALVEEAFKLGASKSQPLAPDGEEEDGGGSGGGSGGSGGESGRMRRRQRAMAAVTLAVAGASGFATIENVVYLIGPSVALMFNGSSPGGATVSPSHVEYEYWNMAVYRLVVVATLHVICGVLTGANIARRDLTQTSPLSGGKNLPANNVTVLWCALPAIFLHGSYNLLVNLLHAAELQSHVHHTGTLWGVGVLVLAAGLLSVKAAGDALQNELRAFVAERKRSSSRTSPRNMGSVGRENRRGLKAAAYIV